MVLNGAVAGQLCVFVILFFLLVRPAMEICAAALCNTADEAYAALLGEDGRVSLEKFRIFFSQRCAPKPPTLAPEAAEVLPALVTPPTTGRKKATASNRKRGLEGEWKEDEGGQDDDEEEESDSYVASPAAKKQKAKKAAPKSAAPKNGAKASKANGAVSKTIRTARLKAVVTSLKQSLKTKKFYSGYDTRANDCTAELALSLEEFDSIFGSAGTLVPAASATSKVIHRTFTQEDLEALFGAHVQSLKVKTVNKPHAWGKQRATGSEAVHLQSGSVKYSIALQKATFRISCINDAPGVDVDNYHGFSFQPHFLGLRTLDDVFPL